MFKNLLAGVMGVTLMLAGAPALAEVVPPADPGPQAATAQASSSSSSEQRALVRIRRDGRYEAARAFSPGDDYLVPTLNEWTAMNKHLTPEEARTSFASIVTENRTVCGKAAGFVVRIDRLLNRYSGRSQEITDLKVRVDDLKGTYTGATWGRRAGTGIGAAFLCALSAGNYCAGAVSNAIGSEIGATGSDRGRDVQRDAMALTMDLNLDHVEAAILNQEMNLVWVELVSSYCVTYFPDLMPTVTAATFDRIAAPPSGQ